MRQFARDVLDSAVTYIPHRARKWLSAKVSAVSRLLAAPPCRDRACCWPDGPMTISGFEPCEPPVDGQTIEQWAEHACLRAHETNVDMIVVDRNHGGGMAVSVLRSTWESLIASGKLPPAAELPRIEETTVRQARL